MVRRLIASAVVVTALGLLGWVAGAEVGDPFRSHQPLPTPPAPAVGSCRFTPQLEMLPIPGRGNHDTGGLYAQEYYLRQQLAPRAAELTECAKLYAEPGADQLARVTVSESGSVHDVAVQGPFVSDALNDCVDKIALHWSFRGGPAAFVLTLPVQYCPGS